MYNAMRKHINYVRNTESSGLVKHAEMFRTLEKISNKNNGL